MRILVTGACGFVGSRLIATWRERGSDHTFIALDNLSRPGSETKRQQLKSLGVKFTVGDLRCRTDVEALPAVDAVIDAAALPSVLSGVDGKSSPRQVIEHNLEGTVNLLEYCRAHRASFTLMSTSRVYSLEPLAAMPVKVVDGAFVPDEARGLPPGVSPRGVAEAFSTQPPVSLYGATKLASETLALEYGSLFNFPVWINRCGVLAGPDQFGQPEQGIVSFWIHSWLRGRPLRYFGFGGGGHQVRDALDPADLVPLLDRQLQHAGTVSARIVNLAGGADHAFSLAQLSRWCAERFGPREAEGVPQGRPLDVPWLVLDSGRATDVWGWRPRTPLADIFEGVARFAEANPHWLDLSAPS